MTDGPWDPGLQHERTQLAWHRTSLTGLACGLVVARFLVPVSAVLAIAMVLTAAAAAVLLSTYSRQRYQETEGALRRRTQLPDARAHLTVSALTSLTAVAALAYVATG